MPLKKTKSSELLEQAAQFHTHLGPYMVLGLRAGMIARQHLSEHPRQLLAIVRTSTARPRSCFLDGVQFSSGCTLGKGNIVLKPSPGPIEVEFLSPSSSVEVKVLEGVEQEIKASKDQESLAQLFWKKQEKELFTISKGRNPNMASKRIKNGF